MKDMNYREQALNGANGVQLVVALYDGAIRFLNNAIECVERGDVRGRREAVKKTIDIFMYLQARLRPDVGGRAAAALSDFYASMFTLTLEASNQASAPKLQEVIAFVRNVRDAWVVVAKDPNANRVLPRELRTREEKRSSMMPAAQAEAGERVSRWSA